MFKWFKSASSVTNLLAAIKSNQLSQAQAILSADPGLIDAADEMGLFPIHWACLRADALMVQLLLDAGDDAHRLGGDEKSMPIHCAAQEGKTEVVAVLLARGASLETPGRDGNTALHFAAREGHLELAKYLLGKGAQLEARCDGAYTPLHLAAIQSSNEVAAYLIERGADCNAQNTHNATPLHYAAALNNLSLVRRLVASGARTDVKDVRGDTPFAHAQRSGSGPVMEVLLRAHGADTASAMMEDAASKTSQGALAVLGAAKERGIVGEDLALISELTPIVAELARELTREILLDKASPRGADFRLIRQAFLYISAKGIEAVAQWRTSGKASVSYSRDDFYAGRSGQQVGQETIDLIAWYQPTAEELFGALQDWCVQNTAQVKAPGFNLPLELQQSIAWAGLIAQDVAKQLLG